MRPISKSIIAGFALFFFALIAVSASADQFSDLKVKLHEARDNLTNMIQNPNKRGPAQQEKVKKSADEVTEALKKIKVSEEKQSRYQTLVKTWEAFQKTREETLVPLLLQGKVDEAVSIASGIQAERFSKMMSLVDELAY